MANLEEIIKVNTEEIQADLVLKNAKLVNVLSEEIYETDIAIKDGKVAGISKGYKGKKEIDLKGAYASPSFIDGHVHIESGMLLPSEFAKLVIPSGTTTVVADPHEIANVMGLQGISFMRESILTIPINEVFEPREGCPICAMRNTVEQHISEYIMGAAIEFKRLGYSMQKVDSIYS